MRRRRRAVLLASVLLGGLFGVACAAHPPLATVEKLDLERYLGEWHQIAHIPHFFQRKCASDTRARYSLREDGMVRVLNSCRTAEGESISAEGAARRNPRYDHPAILQVRFAPAWLGFIPLVWGDYWVLDLTDDYSAVLVGAPNRAYLWVLARQPTLAESTYRRMVEAARSRGFDVAALKLEPDALVAD